MDMVSMADFELARSTNWRA